MILLKAQHFLLDPRPTACRRSPSDPRHVARRIGGDCRCSLYFMAVGMQPLAGYVGQLLHPPPGTATLSLEAALGGTGATGLNLAGRGDRGAHGRQKDARSPGSAIARRIICSRARYAVTPSPEASGPVCASEQPPRDPCSRWTEPEHRSMPAPALHFLPRPIHAQARVPRCPARLQRQPTESSADDELWIRPLLRSARSLVLLGNPHALMLPMPPNRQLTTRKRDDGPFAVGSGSITMDRHRDESGRRYPMIRNDPLHEQPPFRWWLASRVRVSGSQTIREGHTMSTPRFLVISRMRVPRGLELLGAR